MITSRHVLTAAHCMNNALYMVRLGEHDYASQSGTAREDVRVSRRVPHSQYDSRLMINDIAILHLARDVNFNGKLNIFNMKKFKKSSIKFFMLVIERIKPVCLPIDDTMRHKSFIRTTPFVAGNLNL